MIGNTDPVEIGIEGVFDAGAACRAAEQVALAPASARIRIDLSHASEIHDQAVITLAQAVGGSRGAPRVMVHGLRHHHLRLLRYLGLDPGQLGLAPSWAVER